MTERTVNGTTSHRRQSVCTICIVAALALGGTGCASSGDGPDMASLVASLELDPPVDIDVECPLVPEGAEKVLFAGVFANRPPVRPGEPGFPTDFCPDGTAFFARAEGRGNSSILGEFLWSERYCAGTPRGLIAEGSFEGTNGDRLDWDALIRGTPPSSPDEAMSFSGSFTFTGGSGPYAEVPSLLFPHVAPVQGRIPRRSETANPNEVELP